MNDIVIFEAECQQVEVRLEGETVWLTQRQMAELFATTPENVLMHLKNVFKDEELEERATTKDFLAVRQEGERQVKRKLKHYNLDAVISVGYRVNSAQATRFRQWATRVLRDHLTQGYSLNEHRLAQQGLAELEQAVDLLGKTLTRQELVTDIGREVVGLILSAARPASCSPATGARGWRRFSVASSKPCSVSRCTRPAKNAPRICCISSSRTIRFPMATNAQGPSCSCCICVRRACA